MVSTNTYAWKEWTEGTGTEVLYGVDLNANFDYVSAVINKGITGANIATSGIDGAALIADDIIGEAKIDYSLSAGVRLLQIGKSTSTVTGQMIAKGTTLINATNSTVATITVYFSNGDCGNPSFIAAPHVYAYIVTAEPPVIGVSTITSGACVFRVDLNGAVTFTEAVTLYWQAYGNV